MKTKFPYAEALKVANELADALRPACELVEVVGSVRRKKPEPSDVEILYIPRFENRVSRDDMFLRIEANLADDVIERMEEDACLQRRLNVKGSEVFGSKNKLMLHVVSGIPIDLFSTTSENWFNAIVCRTGPKESNIAICQAAQKRGWKWCPYSSGFENAQGEMIVVSSEREVFELVGLPYLPPEKRK